MQGIPAGIEARPADGKDPVVRVHVKVVPGTSKAGLAGPYGDRLRVRVTAAAESGKANKAVLALLAGRLGLAPASLAIVRGPGAALKTIEVRGLTAAAVGSLLYG